MEFITRLYVGIREAVADPSRGQTMAEYSLVLVSIALVVVTGYFLYGQHVDSIVNGLDSSISNA